jgi:hypothetical protein
MDGLKHGLLARRSVRILLAILVAAALLFVTLLSLERSGPSPLHSYNSSNSVTTATTAATAATGSGATTATTTGNNQGNGNNQGHNCNNSNQGAPPRCPSGS